MKKMFRPHFYREYWYFEFSVSHVITVTANISLETSIPFHGALHAENVIPLDYSFEQQSEDKMHHLYLQNLNEKHKICT